MSQTVWTSRSTLDPTLPSQAQVFLCGGFFQRLVTLRPSCCAGTCQSARQTVTRPNRLPVSAGGPRVTVGWPWQPVSAPPHPGPRIGGNPPKCTPLPPSCLLLILCESGGFELRQSLKVLTGPQISCEGHCQRDQIHSFISHDFIINITSCQNSQDSDVFVRFYSSSLTPAAANRHCGRSTNVTISDFHFSYCGKNSYNIITISGENMELFYIYL